MQSGLELPSSHRLPTVSASQALQDSKENRSRTIPLGLETLDALLVGEEIGSLTPIRTLGGIQRGLVSEVYGPPGVGKTSLCMQVCASTLLAGGHVAWMDSNPTIPVLRLAQFLGISEHQVNNEVNAGSGASPASLLKNFRHYTIPTLHHFLSLLLLNSGVVVPAGTTILVIDSMSNLFDDAFPRSTEDYNISTKNEDSRWAAGRRSIVVGDIVNRLAKLAAVLNIAVLVTSNVVTRIRAETGAILRPAFSSQEWENAISTRVLLFRDWAPGDEDRESAAKEGSTAVRYAKVVKSGGSEVGRASNIVVPFTIEREGLHELPLKSMSNVIVHVDHALPARSKKRSRAEIADSDTEGSESEYGWSGEEDQLATEGLVKELELSSSQHSVA